MESAAAASPAGRRPGLRGARLEADAARHDRRRAGSRGSLSARWRNLARPLRGPSGPGAFPHRRTPRPRGAHRRHPPDRPVEGRGHARAIRRPGVRSHARRRAPLELGGARRSGELSRPGLDRGRDGPRRVPPSAATPQPRRRSPARPQAWAHSAGGPSSERHPRVLRADARAICRSTARPAGRDDAPEGDDTALP